MYIYQKTLLWTLPHLVFPTTKPPADNRGQAEVNRESLIVLWLCLTPLFQSIARMVVYCPGKVMSSDLDIST